MALNTSKCNHLTALHYEGLMMPDDRTNYCDYRTLIISHYTYMY